MKYRHIMCTPIFCLIDITNKFNHLEYYRNLQRDHKFLLYQMYYQFIFFLNYASVQTARMLAFTVCFNATDFAHIFPFSYKTPAMFAF